MKIFIPDDLKVKKDKKFFFILTRPFFSEEGWIKKGDKFENWGLDLKYDRLVYNIDKADILLIPYPINYYLRKNKFSLLQRYDSYCIEYNIRGFGIIAGDFGIELPELNRISYFRMGGFKSKLGENNLGFPAPLSDHHLKIYKSNKIKIRPKNKIPKIGFCGHATSNPFVRIYQIIKYLIINISRFFKNPYNSNYEPFFQSGFERFKLLKHLESENGIETEFILREKYRAGAKSDFERKSSTKEFYNNIRNSDYVICLRGSGNFSIRFYETLMMGRIPIFINTDCLLPLEDLIDWRSHVVWIEWEDRYRITEILKNFHSKISQHDFEKLQLNNRQLWLKFLQPNQIFKRLKNL